MSKTSPVPTVVSSSATGTVRGAPPPPPHAASSAARAKRATTTNDERLLALRDSIRPRSVEDAHAEERLELLVLRGIDQRPAHRVGQVVDVVGDVARVPQRGVDAEVVGRAVLGEERGAQA